MEAVGNPKIWVPYMNTKRGCSRGSCSENCPQWCHVAAFPPPPSVDSPENVFKFSPFLITVLGVLFTVLLLGAYFAVISKYCKKKWSDGGRINHDEEMQDAGISSSLNKLPAVGGLDESFIKSITVCVYKKDSDSVEETDCAVCLSEFQENQMLKILPKCSHSFHPHCIDIWLKSHSTCPLCRASLTCNCNALQLHSPPPSSPEIDIVTV